MLEIGNKVEIRIFLNTEKYVKKVNYVDKFEI